MGAEIGRMEAGWRIRMTARNLTGEEVARVERLACACGLCWSACVPVEAAAGAALGAADLFFTGETPDREALYRGLLALAREEGIASAFSPSAPVVPRAVAFDLDATLVPFELLDRLALHAGIGERMARLTERTMRGELDFRRSFLHRLSLLAGLPLGVLDGLARSMPLTEGAAATVAALRGLGCRTAVVTGGFSLFAESVRERLGMDCGYATRIEVRAGRLTGRCVGEVRDERGKVAAVADLCRREGFFPEAAAAVGDGANDIAMLAAVGRGVAYHAAPRCAQRAVPLTALLPLIVE